VQGSFDSGSVFLGRGVQRDAKRLQKSRVSGGGGGPIIWGEDPSLFAGGLVCWAKPVREGRRSIEVFEKDSIEKKSFQENS